MLHLSLIVAPDADFAICVGVIILQVLHLVLPHGRVSPSGSSSRMPGLSLARIRRSHRLLGLLLGHGRSFCKDLAQSARGLNDGPVFVDYIPHFWQVWVICQHEGENVRLGFRPIRK